MNGVSTVFTIDSGDGSELDDDDDDDDDDADNDGDEDVNFKKGLPLHTPIHLL